MVCSCCFMWVLLFFVLALPLFVWQPFNFSRRRREEEKSTTVQCSVKVVSEKRKSVCARASKYNFHLLPLPATKEGDTMRERERRTWKQSVYTMLGESVQTKLCRVCTWESKLPMIEKRARPSNETKNKHLPSGATSVSPIYVAAMLV